MNLKHHRQYHVFVLCIQLSKNLKFHIVLASVCLINFTHYIHCQEPKGFLVCKLLAYKPQHYKNR